MLDQNNNMYRSSDDKFFAGLFRYGAQVGL